MTLPRVVVDLLADEAPSPESAAAGPGVQDPPGAAPGGPVLRVVLEDVGMMDVAATELAGTVLRLDAAPDEAPGGAPAAARPVSAGPDELQVTVAVPVHLLQTRSRYSLRAHLDRDGSGVVAAGDALTTVSVPVDAQDVTAGRRIEVPLTQV